jgi:ankyrin repeat protein
MDRIETQAIFGSIRGGDLEAVRRWLDTYSDLVYVQNADGDAWEERWPLQVAAKHGHLPMVKLLVERGAEVYSNPSCTYPPVVIAGWNKHQAVVDYFLREIPHLAEGTNRLGVTIHLAARLGWTDIVRKHIAADPLAVHQRGCLGDTPLHWPAHNGFVEIVELLLDAGADIEADEIGLYGGKALHWASEHEPATVALLLGRGANVNARNIKADSEFYGVTPLIMNATQRNDCSEVTELLLDAGADINATDAKAKTALAHAQQRHLTRITEVLLSWGAR